MKPFNYLLTIILFFVTNILPVHAQEQQNQKSSKENYFDFWVGNWDLRWESSDGTNEYGKNRIEWTLNNSVLKENFEATTGKMEGYIGKSWSVYNANSNTWKQTWVDNQGSYLDFIGRRDGEIRFFEREGVNRNGEPVKQRMKFYDIKENSFTWDWEVSKDGGNTWQLRWRIYYTRSSEK